MRDHIILETKGYCLFCLKGGDIPNHEEGKGPSFSFRGLLKYLKIDLFSILGKETPQQTLKVLRGCDPKGTLCVKCEQLLDKMLELLEQLELLQLKLSYYLKLTKEEVENSLQDEIGVANYQAEMKGETEVNKKLVERFRKEIVRKCTVEINRTTPKINLPIVKSILGEEEEEELPQKVGAEPVQNVKTEVEEVDYDNLFGKEMDQEEIQTEDITSGSRNSSDGRLKYPCDKCDKVYSNEHTLVEHRRTFHEGIKFKCFLCPFTCNYSSVMSLHKQRVHEGSFHRQRNPLVKDNKSLAKKSSGKYKCSLCEKRFVHACSLDLHRNSAHLGIRFPCKYCGILFTQKGQVNIHIRKRCRKKPAN